jgi:hypothetical protein
MQSATEATVASAAGPVGTGEGRRRKRTLASIGSPMPMEGARLSPSVLIDEVEATQLVRTTDALDAHLLFCAARSLTTMEVAETVIHEAPLLARSHAADKMERI